MEYFVNSDYVHGLCKKYTNLNEEEIDYLINVAEQLPYYAAVNNTEAFIDVKVHNDDKALIVAEFFKENSIYKHSFMGTMVIRGDEPAVFRTFDSGMRTSDIACTSYDTFSGERILSKQTAIPLKMGEAVIGVLTLEKPVESINNEAITTKRRVQLKYNSSENYDVIAEILGFRNGQNENQIREGILMFDRKGYLVYSNNTAKNIYRQLGFKGISNLHFDNINFSSKTFSDMNKSSNYYEEKIEINESYYAFRIIVNCHQSISIVVFIEDITEYRELEKNIEKYWVSYQEIHHRVKNNLQTIASLLRLQCRVCGDLEAKSILDDSVNRVLSIAVTHELLSRNSGDEVSISEVITKLKDNIISFGALKMRDISIEIVGSDFTVSSERATTIALVVNELLQNSLKHAYSNTENGKIIIKIGEDDELKMIEVKDFGKGYNLKTIKRGSLGMEIVESYVYEKLQGKLVVNTGKNGTATLFVFK